MPSITPNNVSSRDKKEKNALSIWQSWSTLLVDAISFCIVLIVCFPFVFNAFNLKPFERGFFCDDQSIMYPYKDDTVSTAQAAVIAVLLFPIVAFFVELLYVSTSLRNEHLSIGTIIKIAMKSFYSLALLYLLGGALTQSIVQMIKLSAGRLRPNFMAWCIPDYNVTNCGVGGGYINAFVCTNNDTEAVNDSKQSFPSGHASSAVYAFTYVAIYLDIRLRQQLKWRLYLRMIAPTVQSGLVIAALYVCLSRVQDNKHHPTDVLAGGIIGLVLCLITIFYWSSEPLMNITVKAFKEAPAIHGSFRRSPNNVNGSQNPIVQSTYSIDTAGQENVTFDVPSSPL